MGYTSLGNIGFNDVQSGDWYYNEVRKAAAAGYISGYDNGTWFAPANPITREEVAMVLYRVSPGQNAAAKAPKGLKDVADIGDWALEAVSSSYAKSYLSGYPDGNFYPKRNLTRAEAVKIINKVIGIDQASRAITELDLSDYTDTRAVVKAVSRSAGTLYWIAVEGDSATPTPLQVSQGKDSLGDAAFKKGNVKVTAYTETSFTADGLKPEKSYTVYAMVKDSSSKLANVKTLRFSTLDEASIGENWLHTFAVGSITENSAVLTARSVEKGTLYWAIVENSSGRPSQTNLTEGKDRDGDAAVKFGNLVADREKTHTVEVTGLKQGTTYTAYGYISKGAGEYSTVQSRAFTTTGIGTPGINSLTASFADNNLSITVRSNEKGKLYWIAVEESGGAAQIIAERVKAGKSNSGDAFHGDKEIVSGENTVTATAFPPLKPNTKYRVYACMEGPNGNLSGVVYTGLIEKATTSVGLTALSITADGKTAASGFTFSPDTTSYAGVTVPNGSYRLLIRPTAAATVDIIVDGHVVASNANYEYTLPSVAGETRVILIETSEAGKSEKKTYHIDVTENPPKVTNVYVSGATSVTPDAAGTTYTATVPRDYAEAILAISFSAEMQGALILEDGTRLVVRSDERKKVSLNADSTTIQLEVAGPANGGDPAKIFLLKIQK
ncbi:MAG: S-layer homology domain-containing protein [Clostridiales Family XIII bacterium]|nr:S-layer homology domain-containing protein [Clostridiales Family XIII bacterium]